jgi:protein ImuB
MQVHTLSELESRLKAWPLQGLMLPAEESSRLEGLGLKHLGEVLALPRFEFERRLGRRLGLHIDRLLGRAPTPLKYWQPQEVFRQQIELPVPTHRSEALLFALNRILAQLQRWLQLRDRALTGLNVELRPEDQGRRIELRAGLNQPGFRRDNLLEILRLKLEPLKIDADIGSLVVRAESTESFRPPQADLWGESTSGDSWEALLDRLQARVGSENLRSIAPCPDHRPEKSWCWSEPGTSTASTGFPERPGWLLPKPRPCRIDDLRLIEGPERIESGWWDGHDCRRDYWIAHDRHGNRLWIFREYKPRKGWFVHGLFG